MNTDPKTLFDPAYLNQVLSFDSLPADQKQEFVLTFLEEVGEKIADIQSLLESGQTVSEIASHAHGIKGSSLSFGANSLGTVAKSLEEELKANNLDGAKTTFSQLRAIFSETDALLRKLFVQ